MNINICLYILSFIFYRPGFREEGDIWGKKKKMLKSTIAFTWHDNTLPTAPQLQQNQGETQKENNMKTWKDQRKAGIRKS